VGTTGASDLRDLAAHLATHATAGTSPSLTFVGLVFILVGLGFKIAVVPFHAWAPDAYEGAPTPVTAFIATGSKVAAFVVAAKILVVGFPAMAGAARFTWAELLRLDLSGMQFAAGWVSMLALVATASMVWGNVAAIAQKNVKRMLAYSSIAHGGYILVGVVAADHMGMTSVLYYVVAYALANLGAFGVVAVLTRAAGGDDLDDMDGMVQRAPGLSLMLLIFVLSLAGVPPLAGFFGKFYVFIAAVNADPKGLGLTWLVVVALATSAVSLYYYLVLLKHVFVSPARTTTARVLTPPVQRVTLAVLAILVVVLGAYPQPLVEMFAEQVTSSRLVP
jgi:NADH-quinone oxidoreductase subunit N